MFDAPDRDELIAQFAAGRAALSTAERALFDRAMYRSEPDTLVTRLRADISAGTLPAVSWLVPTAALSEHPGASTPVGSANLIYQVLDAIAEDRDTWSKTVLLVNFDENDGYFDHVPAPVPPPSATQDWYDGKPLGLGPRVPMTIVSPWTVGGHVNSEVADHTSVIRFLERWTGVAEPNISAWRRAVSGDLTSAFDFHRPGRTPQVDQPGTVPAPITRWHPTPPAEQALPAQEPGRRPARALPYRPRVSVRRRAGQVELTLADDGSASTHFTVYPYAEEFAVPLHVDVTSSHVERIPGAEYRLAVQGPNRFWYELAGGASSPDIAVAMLPSGRSLNLELTNDGSDTVVVTVRSRRYGRRSQQVRLRPRQRKQLAWETDNGWYDVEITASDGFHRGLTGRLENGRSGVTA